MDSLESYIDDNRIYELTTGQPDVTTPGVFKYRPYLLALRRLNKQLESIQDYKREVLELIRVDEEKVEEKIKEIRTRLEYMIVNDETVEKSPEGGKSAKLPDLGIVSLTKPTRRVVIEDATRVLESLGDEYKVVTTTLDRAKASKAILASESEVPGAKVEEKQVVQVRNY